MTRHQPLIDKLRINYYITRRRILMALVPEFVWPRLVNIDGVDIKLRGAPYSSGVKTLLRSGEYELAERMIATSILAPGMTVIEMGSSIGILTAVIARCVGETGTVVAVEASEELTDYSRTWLETDGNIKVVCGYGFPVWQVPAGLVVGSFNSDTGSLGGTVGYEITPSPSLVSPNGTEILDLQTLCERFALVPDVLVLDIEGSESMLLHCAPRIPLTIKHLLIELHPSIYAGGTSDMELIVKGIQDDGFALQKTVGDSHHFCRVQ